MDYKFNHLHKTSKPLISTSPRFEHNMNYSNSLFMGDVKDNLLMGGMNQSIGVGPDSGLD